MNVGAVVGYVGAGCPVLGLARRRVAHTHGSLVQNQKSHHQERHQKSLGPSGDDGQSHDERVQMDQAQVERNASGLGWVGGSADLKAVYQLVYGPQVSR